MPNTAATLRERFKRIPEDSREEHQDFSIRIWRGLSWLERSEEAADLEGRFISLWIAFNSIYGQLEEDRKAEDRKSWQYFLSQIVKLDAGDILGAITREHQGEILHLVYNKFLLRAFWNKEPDWEDRQKRSEQRIMLLCQKGYTKDILTELFERLYTLRVQVFHGGATSGSKYNREYMEDAVKILAPVISAMIEIMIDTGCDYDWGDIFFPVVK